MSRPIGKKRAARMVVGRKVYAFLRQVLDDTPRNMDADLFEACAECLRLALEEMNATNGGPRHERQA
ncbi:MAG TPA: hypothetical protein VN679_08640 [Candidatus Acidoferrales bacterium]|nr:hypothetical protein [Candidatus Acidoferrales bacterium]